MKYPGWFGHNLFVGHGRHDYFLLGLRGNSVPVSGPRTIDDRRIARITKDPPERFGVRPVNTLPIGSEPLEILNVGPGRLGPSGLKRYWARVRVADDPLHSNLTVRPCAKEGRR